MLGLGPVADSKFVCTSVLFTIHGGKPYRITASLHADRVHSPDCERRHSMRSARIGSTLAARLAGITLATRATLATPATASR
jgi:hypothetical protein